MKLSPKSLCASLLAVLVAALVGTVAIGGAALADDNTCTIAIKGDSVPAKACKKGGRKEAAKAMKAMVKAAKAKGTKFGCDDCHADMDTFKLSDNAQADLIKLVAASK